MPYITTVNNRTHTIDTPENGQQRTITFDGTKLTVDWHRIAQLASDAKGHIGEGGNYSLIVEGKSYDVFARRIVKPGEQGSRTYEILLAGQRFEVTVEDERTRMLEDLARSGPQTSEATMLAPMPGLVAGILVEQGAQVEAGQTVVVLEAMKMENDLSSPISGTIKEIRVSKGQTVDQNEVLVIIAS